MGRKPTKYKTSCFVINLDTGKTTPLEELSEKEKEDMRATWSERLSRSMSEYCQTHTGVFATIPGTIIK